MNRSKNTATKVHQIVAAASQLRDKVGRLDFSSEISWVYNPLQYAWKVHQQYIERHFKPSCEILLVGMNPGPWGMSQTGVPFGEVSKVRDWLGLDAKIDKPHEQHPKRPIEGFDCARKEVSGDRFWGFIAKRFDSPKNFFNRHFVVSYCPLAFMAESGLNITPDKLTNQLRGPLEEICDDHLLQLLQVIGPKWVVGVGAWSEKRCRQVVQRSGQSSITVGRILHPSPASPAANKDWAAVVEGQLKSLGAWS